MIYIVLIIFCCMCANLNKYYISIGKRKIHIFYFLAFLAASLVEGFRAYSVGTDTDGTYLRIYNNAKITIDVIRDKGFALLNLYSYKLFGSFTAVLLIVALITNALVFKRIQETSKNIGLSTFLIFASDFYFISMNLVRQSICVAIFIYIFPYINSNKLHDSVKYFIWAAIAISIHTAAWILIPGYFFIKFVTIKPINSIIFTITNLILCKILGKIFLIFFNKSQYLVRYFGYYLKRTPKFSIIGVLIPFSIMLLMIAFYGDGDNNRRYLEFFKCMFLATNIHIFSAYFVLTERMAMFFLMQEIIYIPDIIDIIKGKQKRFIIIFIVVCYLAYMISTIYIQGQEQVLPYKSIIFSGEML